MFAPSSKAKKIALASMLVALATFAALAAGAFRSDVRVANAQQACIGGTGNRCITIVKITTGGDASFAFEIQMGKGTDNFFLSGGDGAQFDFFSSPAVVTEAHSSGFDLVDIDCHTSDNMFAFVDISSGSVEINGVAGEPADALVVLQAEPQDLDEFLGDQTSSSAFCFFINDPHDQRQNVSGALPFLGNAAKKNQTAAAGAAAKAAAPAAGTLKPPSTGDAGLAAESSSDVSLALLAGAITLVTAGAIAIRRQRTG
ncbi:MAG TPA: hypothetical protein VI759_07700 [Dehalococcoidia bacterium]|nr:hypothetical protein [Dehalococcoidia bacterium]